MTTAKKEIRSELAETIEDVFYIAALFRTAGDPAAAKRMGDIGDQLHAEMMRLSKPRWVSS